MLLTDDEIETWLFDRLGDKNVFEQFNRRFCKDLAQAQLQKVVEWGDGFCMEQGHGGEKHRHQCLQCWQSIVDEVKDALYL